MDYFLNWPPYQSLLLIGFWVKCRLLVLKTSVKSGKPYIHMEKELKRFFDVFGFEKPQVRTERTLSRLSIFSHTS